MRTRSLLGRGRMQKHGTRTEKLLAVSIRALFGRGEQGAWYDASDLNSMYQENTGITPVTAPGQGTADCVIGFLVDKRLGGRNALAAELAPATVNFENAFWTASSATPTGNSFTTAAAGGMITTAALVAATKYYEVVMTLANSSTVSLRTASAGADLVTFAAAASREVRAIINASATAFYIRNAAAGTTTVTALSVRELPGNHATQATTASKPVLTARYNVFTASEFPAGVTDAPVRGGAVSATTLTGYAGALAIGFDGATPAYAYKNFTGAASTPYRISAVVKMDDGLAPTFGSATATDSSNSFAFVVSGQSSAPNAHTVTDLGGGLYRVASTVVSLSVPTVNTGIVKYATNNNRTFKITAYDCRTSADAALSIPAYQRVTDASNYDTAGFPWYLKADGVDDGLATAAIDFTGTDKMTVFAGVTKLSDAAAGVVVESGTTAFGVNGTFGLYAPVSVAPNYSFNSRGTANGQSTPTGFASPHNAVLTGIGDIAADISTTRVNGVATTAATDQGTGNFTSQPLYLFRRGGTTLPFNGRCYGLIVRGAATPDATIAAVERIIGRKMGVVL
jgi:hypothetical protein